MRIKDLTAGGPSRGFSYVGLLVSLAVTGVLAWVLLKAYAPGRPVAGSETQKALGEQGLDASSYKSALDSATRTINGLGQRRDQAVDF